MRTVEEFESARLKGIEPILDEINKEYNRHPENWHIVTGYDRKMILNLYFTNKKYWWQIKLGLRHSVGGRIENNDEIKGIVESIKTEEQCGLRQLPSSLAEETMKEIKEYSQLSEKILKRVMSYCPIPEDEITDPKNVFLGVIKEFLVPLSPSGIREARNLDEKLERELYQKENIPNGMYG